MYEQFEYITIIYIVEKYVLKNRAKYLHALRRNSEYIRFKLFGKMFKFVDNTDH